MQDQGLAQERGSTHVPPEPWANLCEFAAVGCLTVARDFVISHTNRAGAALLGLDPSKLPGQRLDGFISMDDLPVFDGLIAKVFEGQTELIRELKIRPASGRALFLARVQAAVDRSRQTCRVLILNIHKHDRAEEERPRETARLMQRYVAAMESAVDGYAVLSPEGQFMEANAALCALSGYSHAELLGLGVRDLEAVETERESAVHAKLIVASGCQRFESRWRCKDGSVIDVEVAATYYPLGNEFFMFTHDVTKHKRTARTAVHLASIIENSYDAIISRTFDGIITSWNAGAERLLGYCANEAIGQSASFIIPPERQANLLRNNERMMRGEIIPPHETKRLTKDGQTIPVLISHSLVRDENEKLVGASFILRDISALKQAQAENERMAAIVENSGDAIWSCGLDGRVISWNLAAERLFGWTEDEMVGTSESLLWPTGRCQQRDALQARITHGESTVAYETVCLRKNSTPVDVEVRVSAIRDAAAHIASFSVIVRDITERKKAQKEISRYVVQLEQSAYSTIKAMSRIVEMRDAYTAGHQDRVGALAKAIGGELGLTKERCEGLMIIGLVHDIGKTGVPPELLAKPGSLTPAEFELIKMHARYGYQVVKDLECPWAIAETILQHHERLDGSGYPRGLNGEEITLEARIIAVADVVEAMCSHRPHREARGIEEALREISRGRGTRFDAAVVDACAQLFRKGHSLW